MTEPTAVADTVRIGLVSISDRASAGVYEDKGLPALRDWLARAVLNPLEFEQRLIADDALADWVKEHPATDVQQLRSLVRAARKEKLEPGERRGRAFRDLFKLVKEQMHAASATDDDDAPESELPHDD